MGREYTQQEKHEIIRNLILKDRIDVLLSCGNQEIKSMALIEYEKLYGEKQLGL